MSSSISSASGFMSEFAILTLQNEQNQSESAQLEREAARENYLAEVDKEVEALHQQANYVMYGGMLNSTLTTAGGVCALTLPDCHSRLAKAGELSTALAKPLSTLFFESTAEHFKADATQAESGAEQARWQAGDASAEIDKASKQADKAIDALQTIQRDQNSANTAIIGKI